MSKVAARMTALQSPFLPAAPRRGIRLCLRDVGREASRRAG